MGVGHHIISVKTCLVIYSFLIALTVITLVTGLGMDFGLFNFSIAMLIATTKASLVMFYFMGLKFDSNENRIIFFSSILFIAGFIALTFSDVMFRKDDVYVPQEKITGPEKF